MQEKTKNSTLLLILLFIIAVRIFAMYTIPLIDTTEARYAHIGYLMATTNDWITTYFDVNIPFWGKPPLSFWAAAISYKIFGMQDFAPRVPSLIFTLMTMALIFNYLKTFYTRTTALWGSIIYMTFLLSYALSGAVITDPYFAFSTSLSMVSFLMVIKNKVKYWGYAFFIGLALGLLSKGPLVVVITGGAIGLWIMFDYKSRLEELKKLPWIMGTLLVLILALPWYILAEIKTPGFLNYFIVGEHFNRFIDSGWDGDLYGSAHNELRGTIWWFWIQSIFPWVLITIYILWKNIYSKEKILSSFILLKTNQEISYLVVWSTFTMLFFTLAGNILMTYTLPALSSLAVLLAIYLKKVNFKLKIRRWNSIYIYPLFVPVAILLLNIYIINHTEKLKTEKYLIEYYKSVSKAGEKLYYLGQINFSALYYSQSKATLILLSPQTKKEVNNTISYDTFRQKLQREHNKIFIAIKKNRVKNFKMQIDHPMKEIYENKRYKLFELKKKVLL